MLFAVTEKKEKDIYNPSFMATLRAATDSVTFLPGTDRARVSSIFTPDVRYLEVVEDGFAGGNVISADFTPTPENLEKVKANVSKAGIIGRLVANDQRGAMIFSELLEKDPITGKTIDYIETAGRIEEIRQKYLNPKSYQLKLKADHEPLKAGDVVKTVYKDPRGLLFGLQDHRRRSAGRRWQQPDLFGRRQRAGSRGSRERHLQPECRHRDHRLRQGGR